MYILVQENKVVGHIDGDLPELHPSYTVVESEKIIPIGWLWNGKSFTWPVELEDEIRELRNQCLSQSDRTVSRFISAGAEVPQEYIDFRQALRDLPLQEGFPYDVNFPEEPELILPEYLY